MNVLQPYINILLPDIVVHSAAAVSSAAIVSSAAVVADRKVGGRSRRVRSRDDFRRNFVAQDVSNLKKKKQLGDIAIWENH
jgi:hypothetical protein